MQLAVGGLERLQRCGAGPDVLLSELIEGQVSEWPTPSPSVSLRLAADYTRSGSSLSTEYGSWQIVSGCGSIHDHGNFPPPLASASSASSAVAAAYDSPLPFSFQDDGPSGRM